MSFFDLNYLPLCCRYSRAVERSAGLRCDQTTLLTGIRTAKGYPAALRRIHYFDAEKDTSAFTRASG